MAKGMDAIAQKYPPNKAEGVPTLPVTLTPSLGLAVAAGDNQPLIVVLAADTKRQMEWEAKVAALAWDKDFEGRFVYAIASSMKQMPKVQGHSITEGILVIEPDIFGLGGKVVKEVTAEQPVGQLRETLQQVARNYVPIVKNRRQLATLGLKEGIFYETGIPVSGRGEAADRERYKKQLELRKKD